MISALQSDLENSSIMSEKLREEITFYQESKEEASAVVQERNAIKTECESLRQQVKALQDQQKEQEAQLEVEFATMKKNENSLHSQVADLQSKLQEQQMQQSSSDRLPKLEANIKKLEQENKQLLQSKSAAELEFESQIKSLETENDRLLTEHKSLESKLVLTEKRINQIQQDHASEKKLVSALESTLEVNELDHENKMKDLAAEKDIELHALQEQIDSHKSAIALARQSADQELQTELKNKTNDIEVLQGQVIVLTEKCKEVTGTLQETLADREKIEEDFNKLKAECNSLQNKCDNHKQTISVYEDRQKQWEAEKISMNDKMKECNQLLCEGKNQVVECDTQREQAEKITQQVQRQLEQLTKEDLKIRTTITNLLSPDQPPQSFPQLIKSIEHNLKQINSADQNYKQLQDFSVKLQQSLTTSQSEKDELRKRYEEINTNISSQKKALEVFKSTIEKLKQSKKAEVKKLKDALRESQRTAQDFSDQFTKIKEDYAQRIREIRENGEIAVQTKGHKTHLLFVYLTLASLSGKKIAASF